MQLHADGRGGILTGLVPDRELQKDNALALSPAYERSGQPDFATDDDRSDLSDTTSILHGAAAITGKASWSAMRVAQANEALALYEGDRKHRLEREQQEARELANLADWNTQMTVVGGVQMTNAEAQAARRRVLANADVYADRAIANGEMDESDRENFKGWMARKIELEDKRGRGTITKEEEAEEARGDRSRAGHAFDHAVADDHFRSAPNLAPTSRPSASAPNQPFDDYALFQATPRESQAAPLEGTVPLAASVKATGLNL